MTSKILYGNKSTFGHGNVNGDSSEVLYENLNYLRLNGNGGKCSTSKQNGLLYNENDTECNGNNHEYKSNVCDVPKTKECSYTHQTPHNKDQLVDSLIPSAARLILSHKQSSQTRSDILDLEEDDNILDFSGDEEEEETFDEDIRNGNIPNSKSSSSSEDAEKQTVSHKEEVYNDYDINDYGLGVIQEETESQMSASDSEDDFISMPQKSRLSSKSNGMRQAAATTNSNICLDVTDTCEMGMSSQTGSDKADDESSPEEALAKHIRISPDWDPTPVIIRIYAIQEPSHFKQTPREAMCGFLNILSGNRKKGTFWNAWKRKYYVLCGGKLNGFERDNCEELFQSINLIGGKVDFLDPVDFVGMDQSKAMTNRIVGIDDAKGHYYVLQCASASEALKWVAALQSETLPSATFHYMVPILPKSLSLFKDVIVIDFGSTNIRAGVLTHQATLPALFFPAVMSENSKGSMLYGDCVYYRENRKNAKIMFPFECSSKMCQNNLNMKAVQGFLLKIFKELNVQPEKYRLVLNLPRRVDGNCKKNILELLFKSFQVKAALLCHQSVASFWAYTADNGIVCDVGERTDIVPVSQGFVLSHAWNRAPFGGNPLKHSLRQGLGPQENGLYLSTPAENLVLRFIAENFVYVSGLSSRKSSQEAQEVIVEMDLRDVLSIPTLIGVNQNVLRGVGEGFFDPSLYGLDCESLPKILYKSLLDCGMDIRKEMSQNIFVTGGCTMIPGFVERLEQELCKLCPPHLKPKIQASPYRYHSSFIGASVLTTTDAFEKSLVYRSKFDGGSGPSHWLV